jgi:hypothetical protein
MANAVMQTQVTEDQDQVDHGAVETVVDHVMDHEVLAEAQVALVETDMVNQSIQICM